MASILIVDDSMLIRQILFKTLKTAGYEVVEASNGIEAMEKIKNENPDCIVLDILMPEMGGFEVIEALKEAKLDIPVIILSADIQKTTKTKCFELGVFDFINKLSSEDELLGAIKRSLDFKKEGEKCSLQANRQIH